MLLLIPASICLGLLVIHSLYFRPLRATFLIFLYAIPASMLYGGADFYIFKIKTPRIPFLGFIDYYPVPIINMVGFVFTFYCVLSLAIHLFERIDAKGRRSARVATLVVWTVFLSAFIGLPIEYTNLAAKWWTWTIEIESHAITGFFQWFGVWSWRSMLIFPILLQHFVPRTKGIGRVQILCALWFLFFFTWMVVVDRILISVLRPLTILLWVALPWIAYKFPPVEVALDQLQFNRPVPVWPRLKRSARLFVRALVPG